MEITVTAFLLAERNVKVDHSLNKSQGKRVKNQGKLGVRSQW